MSKALRDVYTRRDRFERMDVHVGDALLRGDHSQRPEALKRVLIVSTAIRTHFLVRK